MAGKHLITKYLLLSFCESILLPWKSQAPFPLLSSGWHIRLNCPACLWLSYIAFYSLGGTSAICNSLPKMPLKVFILVYGSSKFSPDEQNSTVTLWICPVFQLLGWQFALKLQISRDSKYCYCFSVCLILPCYKDGNEDFLVLYKLELKPEFSGAFPTFK